MVIWKRRTPPKVFTDYTKYKAWLREDFRYTCVYCTIHEGEFGGFHSFHVEHFKPKKKFPKLELEYTNLLYACWKCNSFKGEDWPSDNPLNSGEGYLNPCTCDYDVYFIEDGNGRLRGTVKAATYMIERLNLNSHFLTSLRKERKTISETIEKYDLVINQIEALLKTEKNAVKIAALKKIQSEMITLLKIRKEELDKRFSPPYDLWDLRNT